MRETGVKEELGWGNIRYKKNGGGGRRAAFTFIKSLTDDKIGSAMLTENRGRKQADVLMGRHSSPVAAHWTL